MAHAIDTTAGQSSFVSAHTAAWHQLGTTLDHSFTAEEAMKEGLLGGWNVRKLPLQTVTETGEIVVIPNMSAVVRDNPVIPTQVDVLSKYGVSNGYHIIQNEEHAGLLDALVDESGAHFDTAGSLHGGRQVFLSMKLPGHINVGGVDPVENYITAVNSHDGSLAFTLMVTPVRVVCANTLNVAFGNNSHMFRVRHTSGAGKALKQQARDALDMTFNYLEGFQEQAEIMLNTTMTRMEFEKIIEKAFGAPKDAPLATVTRCNNKVAQLAELFSDTFTQETIRGTAWAGFNALTEWADHFAPTRGNDQDNARAAKAIFDPTFKNQALDLMMSWV